MKHTEHENGVEDGRQAVEHGAELDMTLEDYRKDMEFDIERYKEDATAAEKSTYRAGYMRGVEDALDELAFQTSTGRYAPKQEDEQEG
jgi:hypothetical protein